MLLRFSWNTEFSRRRRSRRIIIVVEKIMVVAEIRGEGASKEVSTTDNRSPDWNIHVGHAIEIVK
jgi:hypothetical protein